MICIEQPYPLTPHLTPLPNPLSPLLHNWPIGHISTLVDQHYITSHKIEIFPIGEGWSMGVIEAEVRGGLEGGSNIGRTALQMLAFSTNVLKQIFAKFRINC